MDMSGMPFGLDPLPYAIDALEPHISRETLEYHHGKHHLGYVNKLNALVQGSRFEGLPLTKLVRKASGALFQSAAQSWNHAFYWRCMSPHGGRPVSNALTIAIHRQFGSLEAFKKQFTQQALSQFGSGWTWLVRVNKDGLLAVQNSDNADNPLRRGRKPVLVCDVWEHAYYIDHRNGRARYLEAFWNVVNWDFASENYVER
jgi:Fe-Mn family superoxide dismutase